MSEGRRDGVFRAAAIVRGIVSLALAFALWFVVADEQESQIVTSVPLELLNLPAGLEVVSQSEQAVDVRLRGPSAMLLNLPPLGIHAQLDLTGEAPGERTWFLGTEDVQVPSGVQVVRVDPGEVELRLDRTGSRVVRVSPRVLGSPATGFEIHQILIEPVELPVSGPETLLRDLEQITTEPISATGLRETYSRRLQIQLDPALRPEARQVDVRLQIGEEREPRDLKLTARLASPGPGDPVCELLIGEVEAAVRIPKSILEQVSAENLFVEVSCSGFAEGFHEAVPRLLFPENPDAPIGLVSLDPETLPIAVGAQRPDSTAPQWEDR